MKLSSKFYIAIKHWNKCFCLRALYEPLKFKTYNLLKDIQMRELLKLCFDLFGWSIKQVVERKEKICLQNVFSEMT